MGLFVTKLKTDLDNYVQVLVFFIVIALAALTGDNDAVWTELWCLSMSPCLAAHLSEACPTLGENPSRNELAAPMVVSVSKL